MADANDSENFEPFWFTPLHYQIPEAERVEGGPEFKEGAPRYKLKPLDGIEVADYIGRINANERGMYVFSSGVVASLMVGFCSSWEGLKFKSEPLAYDLKSLGKVPGHDLHACAGAIIDRSYFAEDDLKN